MFLLNSDQCPHLPLLSNSEYVGALNKYTSTYLSGALIFLPNTEYVGTPHISFKL